MGVGEWRWPVGFSWWDVSELGTGMLREGTDRPQGLSQLQKCYPVTLDKLLFFLNLTLLIWKLGDRAIHHADRELLKRMTT